MLQLLAAVAGTLFALLALKPRTSTPDEPITRMVNFASHQALRVNQTAAEDMMLRHYRTFVDSACVRSSDIDAARTSLLLQLASLPANVRTEIVDMALTPGVSVEMARQNMSNAAANNGIVFLYVYYVNTLFRGDEYSTCVLASGIDLEFGEVVVGSVDEHTSDIVGYKPCHCGTFYCERCPVIKETTTSRPVFARGTGTMQWHTGLQDVLAGMAARQVMALGTRVDDMDEKLATAWNMPLHRATDSPPTTSSVLHV